MALFSHPTDSTAAEPEAAHPELAHPELAQSEAIRLEIQQTLDEMRELAAEEAPPSYFYEELLQRVSRVTGATDAAIWIVGTGSTLHLYRFKSRSGRLKRSQRETDRRQLESWLIADASAHAPESAVLRAANHRRGSLVVAKIASGKTATALLSLRLGPELDSKAAGGIERFSRAVATVASDYQGQRELQNWNQDRDALARFHELVMAVHKPWSKREVLTAAVHEGRRFLDADRVVVALRRRGRYRVAAASGAASLEGRSAELVKLEKLVTAAMQMSEALFHDQSPQSDSLSHPSQQDRPPQIDKPLQAYLEESATKRIAIVPLEPDRSASGARPAAALVVEQMTSRPLDPSSQPLWLVAEHVAVAVDRASRLRQLPLIGPLLGVSSLRKTLTRRWIPMSLLVTAAVVAAVAALLLVKTDYVVRVEGELIPKTQRYVFASQEGVVRKLHVQHGDQVTAGEPLVSLTSSELQRQETRLRGELATAAQRLAAAKTARLEARVSDPTARTQGTLASEQALIEQEIAALEQELELLGKEQAELEVVSPIDGQVVSWDLQQTLSGRPVARGQRLLKVVDLEGDWKVRFRVPDWRAGPILTAAELDDGSQGVPVRFVAAANPDEQYETSVGEIRAASQPDPITGENLLLFEASAPTDQISDLRPGAEVRGQVSCGKRTLAYVWLGELYEELRRRFF